MALEDKYPSDAGHPDSLAGAPSQAQDFHRIATPFFALMVFTLPIEVLWPRFRIGISLSETIGLVFIFLTIAAALAKRQTSSLMDWKLAWLIILFIALNLLSASETINPFLCVKKMSRLAYLFALYCALAWYMTAPRCAVFARALVAGTWMVAAAGLLQAALYFAGLPVGIGLKQTYHGAPRISASFIDPNNLGYFMAFCVPFVFALQQTALDGAPRRRLLALWVLSFIVLVMSLSRGGMFGATCGILLCLFVRRRVASAVFAIVPIFLFGILLVWASWDYYGGTLMERVTHPTKHGAEDVWIRLRIMAAAGEMFWSSPIIGIGPGQFSARVALTEALPGKHFVAHNSLIEIGVETGIIGAAVFLVMLLYIVKRYALDIQGLVRRHCDESRAGGLALACICGSFGCLGASMFLSNVLYRAIFAIVIVTLGVARGRLLACDSAAPDAARL